MAYLPSSIISIFDPNTSVVATVRNYANSDPLAVALTDVSGNALIGQKNMAGSAPVVIASDQAAIPAQQSGTWVSSVQLLSTSASVIAVGNVSSGVADAGDPVKVGGRLNTTLPTFSDGQRGDLQLGTRGALKVALFVNNSTLPINPRADNADTVAVSTNADNLTTLNRNTVFNNTTWDRMRGDVNGIYLSSIASGAQALGKLEDAAHATGDSGVFVLGVRNDTMSSVTSADGDYSAMAQGPVGETIVANAPITKWIRGETSVMYGTSVQAIAAQGASIFTYITSAQIVNMSPTISLVKFTGGLGSTLAYTVAPASGGSNIVFANPLRTGENSGVSASISGVSSVFVSLQGFTAKI